MTPRIRFIALAAAPLLVVLPAIADTDASLESLRRLTTTLSTAGHPPVRELDRDWLGWKVEVCDASGHERVLRVSSDGRTVRNGPYRDDDDDRACEAAALAPATLATLAERLVADGLREIEEIELDDGIIEVEARDAQGRKVERRYAADTLAVLANEPDDDHHDD